MRILYRLTNTVGRHALFFGILWRDWHGTRIGVRAAWKVARIVYESSTNEVPQ